MDLNTFRSTCDGIGYGKKLPTALYLFRPRKGDVGEEFAKLLRRAEVAASPDSAWNLLKVHTDKVALTFLTYPDFDYDPHPALAEATMINLNTGRLTRTDYRARANPPILHRKETFLPGNDPRISQFAALTKEEEAAGLYRDPSRIGLRVQWLTLLKRLGLTHEGNRLKRLEARELDAPPPSAELPCEVERYRTAIKRYDLSKPVKQLLERGLLRKSDTFFDYGCGHGMDVEALHNLGYTANGWDPAFRPNAPKTKAAVVNLGYVLNVIENPAERIAALRGAFELAERVLLVSTLVTGQETDAHRRPYGDGFITKTNTFQKFYAPGELEAFIEHTLDVEVTTLALGICVAFRNEEDAELFEVSRNRRRIDWTEISSQLRFSAPVSRSRSNVDRYALHKELLDEFWSTLLDLGRTPEPGEFDRLPEVKKAAGGLTRAVTLVREQNGENLWQVARKARTEDVLVYLAMSKFRKRFLRREIPLRTKHDIRSFFGDLPTAQARATDLLLAAGDPDEISLACEDVKVGWQDAESLIVHRSLFAELPSLLRIYVYCAAQRYGDPAQADLIKIHKRSGKVTFQHYDDFEGKPLPELRMRIKVNLRNLFVQVFDYSESPKTQLLFFKERFLPLNYPGRAIMEKFSDRLRTVGLDETTIGHGPDKETWLCGLRAIGVNESLRPLRKLDGQMAAKEVGKT